MRKALRALRRKVKTTIRTLSRRFSDDYRLEQSYKRCIVWIHRNTIPGEGIAVTSRNRISYPEVTGYFIPTLLSCGEADLAFQYACYLLAKQSPDGSWSDPRGKAPYTFDSGQILKGLCAIHHRMSETESAIRRGCDWLITQIDAQGKVNTPDESTWNLPGGKKVTHKVHLYAVEPLLQAGRMFNEPRYLKCFEKVVSYYRGLPDITDFDTLAHFHAYVLEALVDCGERDLALKGMACVEKLQHNSGALPAYSDVDWTCSTANAQYAVTWYKLGRPEFAEKTLRMLCRLQNRSGGFFGSYGAGSHYFPQQEIGWAVKYFIDAYLLHLRTAFEKMLPLFPASIDENDNRPRALIEALGPLGTSRVLDAGCGKGRFAKLLKTRNPDADIWGADITPLMFPYLSDTIKCREGSILNLPFGNNEFDHIFCIEALEHSLNPEESVNELCRVVKPGGSVIVIDKNARLPGWIERLPWEKWFEEAQVTAWLAKHCSKVTTQFIVYGNTTDPPANRFILWKGIRS
jgi:malonyl-CoA O-methyltransferase